MAPTEVRKLRSEGSPGPPLGISYRYFLLYILHIDLTRLGTAERCGGFHVLRTDRRTRREEGKAMVNAKALRLRLKKHEVTKRNAQQKVCQIVTPKLFKT